MTVTCNSCGEKREFDTEADAHAWVLGHACSPLQRYPTSLLKRAEAATKKARGE